MKKYKNNSIKNWAVDDRPREKMLLKGREALSNAELIAILLGSGNHSQSALELAQDLLKEYKNQLSLLSKLKPKDLMQIRGIGIAKAVSIAAAFELARRRISENTDPEKGISSVNDAVNLLIPMLRDKTHEEFYMICLSRSNKPLSINKIGEGGFSSTIVDVRKLYRIALQDMASSILLGHNHPSGTIEPSNSDINLTKKIQEGGQILDISLIDHIIITDHSYYSFVENDLIKANL